MPPATDGRSSPVAAPRRGPAESWRERLGRVGPALSLAGVVLAVSVLLHLRDPHRSGSWGFCPWLTMTGTYCPLCGGLRAVDDLTDGNVRTAASSNLLLVTSLPFVALLWTRTVLDRWRGVARAARPDHVLVGCLLTGLLALAFAVVRNTTAGAWLAP